MRPRERIIRRIPLDSIDSAGGPRPVDTEAVERLAASVGKIGMHSPITVEGAGSDAAGRMLYRVVSGRHRVAAARQLGWTEIEAVEFTDNPAFDNYTGEEDFDLLAEMWAIAENLHRADLSKEQRDEQIRRYAELLEKKEASPKTGQVVQFYQGPGPGRGKKGIARKVSEQTGVSAKTVKRALAPKVTRVADEPLSDDEARERQVATLMSAWNKASPEAREQFLARIDRPVMDERWSA